MRLRIILLAVAISSMILVSFLVPLALLLRTFQEDRAVSAATVQAQFMAPLVATLNTRQLELAVAQVNALQPSQPVTIFMPDGTTLGAQASRSNSVQLAEHGRSLTDHGPRGTEVLVAVSGLPHDGTAVVRTFVSQAQLNHGVLRAWLLLGGVGLGLIALSVIVSAQLARSLVRPLRALATASERLAAGDLSARAPFEGAPEIRKVSLGLNRLAVRIGELLAHERETVADLSHRLRTPLTALRIDAESLGDEEEMSRVIAGVDDVSRTVNEIIREARRPTEPGGAACDVVGVVAERTAFWRPLAEDQDRRMGVDLPDGRLPVLVPTQDMAACLDILLENVFAHTPEGTVFSVRVSPRARGGAWLVVSDDGPGFAHPDAARRGLSSGGSTGLGLDIALRIAEASGGTLTLGRSPAGGAAVTVGLGPSARLERPPRRHVRARAQAHLPGHRNSAERDPQLAAELSAWAAISGRDPGAR